MTPAGESGGGNTMAGPEEHSSEGYTTPRSLETPVQANSNLIRDPYASRLPSSLRHHNEQHRQQQLKEKQLQLHQQQQQQQQQGSKQAGEQKDQSATIPTLTVSPSESIYTILIRLPPKSTTLAIDNGSTSKGTSIQVK